MLRYAVRRPWLTARTTAAALARKLAKDAPTLLLDESDTALADKTEYASMLTGILNAGFSRSLPYTLCLGEGANLKPQDLSVFGPKAIAGIGSLPTTIADRSIPIRLRRKLRSEMTERARDRVVKGVIVPLSQQFEQWAVLVRDRLSEARPALPDLLDDRAQDILEPLLAIADLAGGDWPSRGRRAAVQVVGAGERDDDAATQLLADVQDLIVPGARGAVVTEQDGLIVATALLAALEKLEDRPWATWSRGELMTPHALAKQLEKFEVWVVRRWSAGLKKMVRGYAVDALNDAFARYVSPKASEASGDQ